MDADGWTGRLRPTDARRLRPTVGRLRPTDPGRGMVSNVLWAGCCLDVWCQTKNVRDGVQPSRTRCCCGRLTRSRTLLGQVLFARAKVLLEVLLERAACCARRGVDMRAPQSIAPREQIGSWPMYRRCAKAPLLLAQVNHPVSAFLFLSPPPSSPYRPFLAMPGSVVTLPAASGGGWRGRRGCEQARHGALAAGPSQFAGSARPGAPASSEPCGRGCLLGRAVVAP